ncbi:MAG: hypothetical protein ACE5I1_17025 [bacterium]
MSHSKKQGHGNPAKTKAEIKKELAKTQKELEQALVKNSNLQEHVDLMEMRVGEAETKLKDRSEQAAQLQQDVDELKRTQENAQIENEKLRDKIQEIKASSVDPSELDALNEKLRAAKQKQQEAGEAQLRAEAKSRELENTILELESKLVDNEKNHLNGSREIPTSKATFRIYLFPGEGDYLGTIEHLPTNAKKNFQQLDKDLIFEFISEHLPQQITEEETIISSKEPSKSSAIVESTKAQPEPAEAKKVEKPSMKEMMTSRNKVLQEIKFEQFRRILEFGATMRARRPFNVHISLRFPVIPNDQNMDIDTSAYTVQIMAKNLENKNVIERSYITDMLSPGITSYKNMVSIPGMEPGKYMLTFYTFAPFANVEESRQFEIGFE